MGMPIADQDRAIRCLFPDFRLVNDVGLWAVWEGALAPGRRSYCVRVIYFPRIFFPDFRIENPRVSITVEEPVIGLDPRGTGELPPHIYPNFARREFPMLCLFDPAADEWNGDKLIAETILPWAAEWLFFFEGWMATGDWLGGGRHPERSAVSWKPPEDLDPELLAQRERDVNAAFHKLGRKTGNFASFALMAAASEGSFPPRYWRGLKSAFFPENPSLATSISSLGRPPAEFSLSDLQAA
jgi:hypothetical protein